VVWCSYNEGEYARDGARSGLLAALADAENHASSPRDERWRQGLEPFITHIGVIAFSIAMGRPDRVIAKFPVSRSRRMSPPVIVGEPL
jgi:hypothetical protein